MCVLSCTVITFLGGTMSRFTILSMLFILACGDTDANDSNTETRFDKELRRH